MKRKELASGKELEMMFTENAYDLWKKDVFAFAFLDRVCIRLVHHYKIYDEDVGPVFLVRLADEKTSSYLQYHSQEWYDLRA